MRWEPRRSEWSSDVQRPVGVVESVKTQIPVARYEVSFGTWVWLDRRGRQRAARSDSTTVESHPPKRGPETQTRTEVAQGEPQVGLMVGSRTAAGGVDGLYVPGPSAVPCKLCCTIGAPPSRHLQMRSRCTQ